MSEAATIAPASEGSKLVDFLRILPGIALLAAIGLLGKLAEQSISAYGKSHHLALPNIEYVLWAILIGLAVSNTIGVPEIFRPGVATYELWLKIGIVLLGVRFLMGDVAKLGTTSLVFVAIELAVSIAIMTWLGRALGLSPKLTSLLAIGSSICGVSAIIAAKGAIEADDEDVSYAIGAILALGAFSLFAFPAIGHLLGMSDHAFGLWAGLAVDNTAEATAAGALYSAEAAKFAVLAKTTRNATIGFVVLAYAVYWARKSRGASVENKAAFLWQKFPKFVLGFLGLSVLFSVLLALFTAKDAHAYLVGRIGAMHNLSEWAFQLTFIGVGLRTSFRDMARTGVKPLVVGLAAETAVAGFTLAMVFAAAGFLPSL